MASARCCCRDGWVEAGSAVDAHPFGGGVRGAGEGLELLGDVLGRVGRVQVGLAVVVEVGDELVGACSMVCVSPCGRTDTDDCY